MAEFTTNQGNVLDLDVKTIETENDHTYEVVTPPVGWLGISGIADETGYQPQYVRKLVLDDKIEAIKIGRKGYEKWYINPNSAEEYRQSSNTRGGKRRFIFKTDLENEDAVRQALDEAGIDYDLELQYQPKEDDDESEPEAETDNNAGEETLDFLNE
jgi:hypothetical protein